MGTSIKIRAFYIGGIYCGFVGGGEIHHVKTKNCFFLYTYIYKESKSATSILFLEICNNLTYNHKTNKIFNEMNESKGIKINTSFLTIH